MSLREQVEVRVTGPVDGTKRRRAPRPGRARSSACVTLVTVLPEVLATAHAVRREGERLVIVSATRVDLVRAS